MQKGISPVISFVMIVAIVITSTMIAWYWAYPTIQGLGEPGKVENFVGQMTGLDYAIRAAAHGDIGFVKTYEMYLPEGYLEVQENSDSVNLFFNQQVLVVGYSNITGGIACNYSSNNLFDNESGMNLYRSGSSSTVLMGARASGISEVELKICYEDINLTYGGTCQRTSSGAKTVVTIKKLNYTSMPVVQLDLC